MRHILHLAAQITLALVTIATRAPAEPPSTGAESAFAAGKLTLAPIGYGRTTDLKHHEAGAGLRLQYDAAPKFALNLDLTGGDLHDSLIERGAISAAYGIPIAENFRVSAPLGLNYDLRNGDPGAHAGLRLEFGRQRLHASIEALAEKTVHRGPTAAVFQGAVGFTF